MFCLVIIVYELGKRIIQQLQYNISWMLREFEKEHYVGPDGSIYYPLEKFEGVCTKCGQKLKRNN
jgi:hypothetical protein